MCGIVGYVQRKADRETLSPMLSRIVRRGPDAEGRWFGERLGWNVALGHRRLSIVDLESGVQPMSTADGAVHVTYNGELYNFAELRAALEKDHGTRFRTRSDTEVVLEQAATHGTRGLRALSGMFAFATWDARSGRLLLVRDRIGIKPLYYASLADGGLVFASTLAAILEHPGVAKRFSRRGLESYLFADYVHPPHSIVDGVRKLPPGHYVEWIDGRIGEPAPYWRLGDDAPDVDPHARDLPRQLWQRLGDAVERQLMSDVPLGVFLSGGIDSSCVATLARQRSGKRLQTFAIAFRDRTFDESEYARKVAKAIDSNHVEEQLDEENLLGVMDEALAELDEPLADPSYLPTFLVSRLAAAHVKVVLSGDGGDEVFGGYPTYRAHDFARVYRAFPGVARTLLERVIAPLREQDGYQSLEWKLKRFVLRFDDDTMRRHLRWMSSLDLDDLSRALPNAGDDTLRAMVRSAPLSDGTLNSILGLDLATYLPGSVLTKVDRASMAHGLEVRPPMLDEEIVGFMYALPARLKVRANRTKILLKRAARGHVPDEIIQRPKKGFGIPLRSWLRGPLQPRVDEALRDSPIWSALDRDAFREWSSHLLARRGDYTRPIWAMLVLHAWAVREGVADVSPR